jgi:hypothetical protein
VCAVSHTTHYCDTTTMLIPTGSAAAGQLHIPAVRRARPRATMVQMHLRRSMS